MLSNLNQIKCTIKSAMLFAVLIIANFLPTSLYANVKQNKPTLIVYTYSSFISQWGPGEYLKKEFEPRCDCHLKFVTTEDVVALINLLKREGAKTKADVIVGLDDTLMDDANQLGLVQPHQIKLPENIKLKWNSSTFIPYDVGYYAFIYDSKNLANPPRSLDELIHNDKLTVIYPDPRTSSPGLGLLLWIQSRFGDNSSAAWHSLAKHTVTVPSNWSDSYSLFLRGESDVVLSYTTSPIVHALETNQQKEGVYNLESSRYRVAQFDGGHYEQIEVAAITKASKQKKLAQQFLQFLLSDQAQYQIATQNMMYPITNIVLPTVYNVAPTVNIMPRIAADQIAHHRKQWVKQWLDAAAQ